MPFAKDSRGAVENVPRITVVMPVRDSMRYLPRVVPPLLNAGRRQGNVEFVFVDNGSTDGSREYLHGLEAEDLRVLRIDGVSVAGLRNFGAAQGTGDYLSFVDADCEVDDGYFAAALADLDVSGAAATGHAYALPPNPGWIERAWSDLHYQDVARDVAYLNAGNFFVRRAAFEAAGGFREDLRTGEDAELGQRLARTGARIHANPRVRAVHLGNPRTLREFYRRAVWHGLGIFGTVRRGAIDRPTAMLAVHLGATLAGVGALLLWDASVVSRVSVALALQLVAPLLTVVFRWRQVRRIRSPLAGTLLYWLYYWARANALLVLAGRGARAYRK